MRVAVTSTYSLWVGIGDGDGAGVWALAATGHRLKHSRTAWVRWVMVQGSRSEQL
jgi:hypothetical protein